jgi:hypothetical protein
MGFATAQKRMADIKFNTTTYDFGKIPEEKPVATCNFIFTNTGNAPLVIQQVTPSCGCTTADFPKKPIMPKKKGIIKITYDGKNKPYPGIIHKSATVRTNGKTGMILLYIDGEMTPKKQ